MKRVKASSDEGAVEGDAHRAILGDYQNQDDAKQATAISVTAKRIPVAAQRAREHERQVPAARE
jgi:hypothetical protein